MNNMPSQSRPLSQSPLWEQQSAFYERLGQQAWRGGFVPEYITSNPFIANAYAQMVLAYWHDGLAAATLTPTEPCYILELGAGSGRFAYLFLTRLTELLADWQTNTDSPRPRFIYVMTDVAQANLTAWQANSRLADFVAAGTLDFARFDAARDTTLTLLTQGTTLAPNTLDTPQLTNPGIIIANYVFDSIPSDLYYVEDSQLFERRIGLENAAPAPETTTQGNGATRPESAPSGQPTLTHTHHPFDSTHLDDPVHGEILRAHAERLNKTVFPLPVAALDACRRLHALMHKGLLLLVGDKGYMTWAGLQAVGNPQKAVPGMAFHSGCFSVMVNFPALAQAIELSGGAALLPDHEPHRLGVAALLLGAADAGPARANPPAWTATRRAFAAQVDEFGPDDFYVLAQTLEDQLATLNFHRVLAILRLSRWDPQLLTGCLPTLAAWAHQLTPVEWIELRNAIERTLAHDYPSTTRYDLAYGLGRFFFERHQYADALRCYTVSRAHQPPNTQMLYEMAVCQVELAQRKAALETLAQVLERAPRHQAARDLHAYLRRKQKASANQ